VFFGQRIPLPVVAVIKPSYGAELPGDLRLLGSSAVGDEYDESRRYGAKHSDLMSNTLR
jgi:hypothetical protein